MSVRTIDLNNERLSRMKTKMLKNVLGNAFKTDATPNFNGTMYVELLGGSFESVQEKLESIPAPTEMQVVLKSLCNTIDVKIDGYAAKKGYKTYYSTEADDFDAPQDEDEEGFGDSPFEDGDSEETKDEIAFNDADTDIEKGENPNVDTESFDSSSTASGTIAETVKELFEDLALKQAGEIRNLAKTVMKLEKTNQDILLKERKAEDGEFIEDLDTPDKKEDDNDTTKDTVNGEDSDGFGGDDNGGDDWTGDNGDNSGGFGDETNPLDTPDNDEEGSNGEEGSEDNDGQNQSNPFDNNNNDEGSDEEDKAFGGFESHITDYGYLTARILGTDNRYNPFKDMSVGSVLDFAKYHANEAMKNDLSTAYASESIDNLNNTMDKYSKLTKALAHSTADTLAIAAYIGLPFNKDKVKYPEL